jgi:hypothetical protein
MLSGCVMHVMYVLATSDSLGLFFGKFWAEKSDFNLHRDFHEKNGPNLPDFEKTNPNGKNYKLGSRIFPFISSYSQIWLNCHYFL